VHDNQVYGLTKGQASPTTAMGTVTKTQPFGDLSEPLNPMALAVALNASFAARGFAGDLPFLKDLIKAAITNRGYSLIDVLQPCITFNKVNTFDWYRARAYRIEPEHDPTDRLAAFKRALEWGERIPTGVIYRSVRPTMEERIPVIKDMPLAAQGFDIEKGRAVLESFMGKA
jgi:2-oxoglutarate ferredoxin oxidoreductase subunit beta